MNAFLASPLLQRLGLTLFHALWEGTLIGLAAWAGLALLRRREARVRYQWACLGLAAMVLVPAATFARLGSAPLAAVAVPSDLTVWGDLASAARTGTGFHPSAWLPWAALLWALGAVLMLARLGGGLWWLERNCLRQAGPAPAAWETRLRELARRMGCSRQVQLRVSNRIGSPLLLGWLRPVILVPASAFLALPPESLEAVLAHELAHLRRGDFLANLLQTFAEAFLFFHPAAWWLSRQIRELREHCCDDEAAALLGDPLPLAQGLAALAALRRIPSDPEPALAAVRGTLMNRITRLFHTRPSQAPSLRGLILLLAGATLFGTSALAAHQAHASQAPIQDLSLDKVEVASRPEAPAYPAEAKAKGITGTVVVQVIVATDGRVETAKALSGPEALQATAVDYAKGWRFVPAQQNGQAVRARFKLTMPFRLRNQEAAVQDFQYNQVKLLHRPDAPAYPAEAKAQRIQGTVVVEVVVGTDGIVESARALEGPEALRETAVAYAKAWAFAPMRRNGEAVKARFKLTMPFRLN